METILHLQNRQDPDVLCTVSEGLLCRGGKGLTHGEASSKASTALLHSMWAAAFGAQSEELTVALAQTPVL